MARYDNAERNAEIIRRRQAGELPSDIRRAMGISRGVVAGVLDRAGVVLGGHADGCRKYNNPTRGEERWNAILGEADVRAIRAEYVKGRGRWHRGNASELAARYGVKHRTIVVVAAGQAWKHVA